MPKTEEIMQKISDLIRKWNMGATETTMQQETAALEQAMTDNRLRDRPGVATPQTTETGERRGK